MKKVYCEDCRYLRSIHDIWHDSETCKKWREKTDRGIIECQASEINKNNDCKVYEESK